MSSEWFSCKPSCLGSDPTSDTVKVDFSRLFDKENVQPTQASNTTEGFEQKLEVQKEIQRREQKESEQRLHAEAAEKHRRREQDEAKRCREEQATADCVAAERAAVVAQVAAAAKAERKKAAEAERLAQEKARQEFDAAEKAALLEAKHREDQRLAQEKVNRWCKANGFNCMDSKKTSFMGGSKFPLHEAVAKKDGDMVALMVQLGADQHVQNSKGQTPLDLALKMSKKGSLAGIVSKLS